MTAQKNFSKPKTIFFRKEITMKKQHRIVSLLLVFTLLFGSLIFTTGGTTAVAADSGSSSFTPTATLETASIGSGGALAFAFDAGSDINTGAAIANYANNYDGYKITSANGDTMLELVPVKTGEVTGNCQFTIYGKTNIAYDSTKSQYAVYDFDMATESDLLDLYINPNMRDASNGDAGLWGGSNLSIRSIFDVEPGKFHHVTIVQDLNNNKQYIFLDNILVNSESAVTNGYSAWLAGTSTYKNSLKIQSHASYGNNTCKLTLGQSILFDNIGLENYSYAAGTTSLTEALAAGDLSLWTDNKFNDDYTLPEVPVIAEVDGVAYSSTSMIEALLNWGSKERAVTLMRDSATDITVNMPATIVTNGLTNYKAGDKVTASGTGTVSFAFTEGNDFNSNEITEQTFGDTVSFNSGTLYNAVRYIAADNILTRLDFNNEYFEANGRIPLLETNTLSGASFVRDGIVSSFTGTPNKNHWICLNTSYISFDHSQDHFMLIDFDVMLDDANQSLTVEFQVNSSDHTMSASDKRKNASFPLSTVFKDNNLPLNQFVHITLAASVKDNLVYIFADGSLVSSAQFYRLLSDNSAPTAQDAYKFEHIRLIPGNSHVDYSFSNIYIRDTVDASMRTAVNSRSILDFSGNVYGSYVPPTKVTTMIVDGEFTGSAAYAGIKLSDGTPSYVVLENNVTEELHVAENAIIRTNNYECNVVAAEGYKASESQEALNGGSLIIITSDSASGEDVPAADSNVNEIMATGSYDNTTTDLIKSSIANNIFNRLSHINFNVAHGRAVYHVTDTVTGNVLVHEATYGGEVRYGSTLPDGTTNPNVLDSYVNWAVTDERTNGSYKPGTNHYLVIDADIALETNDPLSWSFNTRRDNGSGGNTWILDGNVAVPINTAFANAGIGLHEFAHVTVIGDTTTGIAYTFVNGKLANTTVKAICDPTVMQNQEYWLQSIRIGQNPSFNANYYYDNVAIRSVQDAAIATAIENGDITSHSINVYGTYAMPTLPVIASVDGVYYDNEAKLSEALTGGAHKNVEFFHQPSSPVAINCDATINTNGFKSCIAPVDGAAIIGQIGAVIYTSGEGKANVQDVVVDNDTFLNNRAYLTIKDGADGFAGDVSMAQFEEVYELSKITYKDDTYLRIYTPKDVDTTKLPSGKNNFQLTTMMNKEHAIAYDSTVNQYAVYDFDIGSDTKYIGNMFIRSNARKAGADGNQITYFNGASPIFLKNLNLAVGRFNHVTVIQDFTNCLIHVYVNNEHQSSVPLLATSEHEQWKAGTIVKILPSFKIETDTNNTKNVYQDESIFFDNMMYRGVSGANIAVEDLLTVYNDSYDMPELQPIATVDGVEYSSISDIEAALADGGTHAVYLLREPLCGFGTITVGSSTTIAHNGYDVNVIGTAGYKVTTSAQNIFVEPDSSEKKISLIVNGTEFKLRLENGTNLKAYLEKSGSYFGDKNIFALNGKVYYDVVWDVTPDFVSGDRTYTATGTELTEKYLVHQNGTLMSKYNLSYINESSGSLRSALIAGENQTIILNSNVALNSAIGVGGHCTKDVYLNGYTISLNGGNHGFILGYGSILSMYGPGEITDMGSVSTHGLFYSGQNPSVLPELLLKDLTVNGTQALSQFRAGNMTVDGCDIKIATTQCGTMFQLGHADNTTTMTTNIIDSTLSYQTYGSPSYNMFHFLAMAAEQDHILNIEGSTIISELGLFGNISSAANTVVNISDSKLISPKWNRYAASSPTPTINLIDNVSLCSSLSTFDSGDANIKLADGLEIVKTNNYQTPITYAKDYTTVILANGKTEKWAIGSTPIIPGAIAYVEKAEGGTQFLATGLATPPFSLKGNLSLGAEIAFNLYVPTDAPLVNITVNDVTYYSETVKLNGELVDAYRIPLTPVQAASAFDVIFNCGSYSVSQTLSVTKYASVIYATGSAEAKALMSATLDYIKGTVLYSGANGLDVSEITALISNNAVTSYTLPTTSNTDTTNITAYLDTAQLSLDSAIKFRFNLKDGVDGSAITVKVDGVEKKATVTDDYIEIELKAYEMAKTISFEVDGITTQNTYDLAKYCITISGNAAGTSGDATSRLNYIFVSECNMLSRLYNYAKAAEAYNATISN